MNINQRNGVLAGMHEALSGKRVTIYDQQGVTAEEMIAVVPELKTEHAPKYDAVKAEKNGPNSVTFTLELAENETFGHGAGTE